MAGPWWHRSAGARFARSRIALRDLARADGRRWPDGPGGCRRDGGCDPLRAGKELGQLQVAEGFGLLEAPRLAGRLGERGHPFLEPLEVLHLALVRLERVDLRLHRGRDVE